MRGVDLVEFSTVETTELVGAVLGGDVDERVVDRLHHFAAGSPLMLRGVLNAARADGTLERAGGRWRLNGPLRVSADVRGLIESRLAVLTPPERELVEMVSFAEVLDWSILRGMFAPDLIDRVERLGIIQIVDDGPNMMARPAHPIIGEVARTGCGTARARHVNATLARSLRRVSEPGESTTRRNADVRYRIQLAQFMIRQ